LISYPCKCCEYVSNENLLLIVSLRFLMCASFYSKFVVTLRLLTPSHHLVRPHLLLFHEFQDLKEFLFDTLVLILNKYPCTTLEVLLSNAFLLVRKRYNANKLVLLANLILLIGHDHHSSLIQNYFGLQNQM